MALLATDEGTKTPEQIAEEIVNDAVESVMVEISGTANQKLETVVKYLNRDKIQARGENWFRKEHDRLVTDAIETLVVARHKAIVEYMNKKELQAKDDVFRDLVARGWEKDKAYNQAYN